MRPTIPSLAPARAALRAASSPTRPLASLAVSPLASRSSRSFSSAAPTTSLMDPTILTESQREVRDAVAGICSNFPNSYWRERDETKTYPFDFQKAIADGGWLGISLPEENGGSGLGVSEACIMMQTITESGAGGFGSDSDVGSLQLLTVSPGFPGAQCTHANIYATQPLAIFGSPEQRAQLIPKIIAGEYRTCFAVTEPNAGLNTLELTTSATRRPDGTWVCPAVLYSPSPCLPR